MTYARLVLLLMICMMFGCSGGGNPTSEPPKVAIFKAMSVDKCEEIWNGNDFGIKVGCTVKNIGQACGSTNLRLWVTQRNIVVESKLVPISLCPSQTVYVEVALWEPKVEDGPWECYCQCT
jgi:hypothetical protein